MRRAGSTVLTALVVALLARDARAQTPDAPPVPAQDRTLAGTESDVLASLREAEQDQDDPPATVADGASRASVALPAGLDPAFAAQLQLPSIVARVTPTLAARLSLFRTDRRAQRALAGWVRRAGRYRSRIESILVQEGVPRELVWVVAAESGFDPREVSAVGAVGLWQLMPEAARTYGLRVDAWVDERRDPVRSTHAAARYLRDLHARFGAWDLALAAYNMGYNALLRAMRRFNTNDLEALADLEAGLPFETLHYVPRILAASVAASNARAFGLDALGDDAAVDWSDAALSRSVPLGPLATALGVSVEALRVLNPALLGSRTPPSDAGRPFLLHVPGTDSANVEALARGLALTPTRVVRLRHGETLEDLAGTYRVSPDALLVLSGLANAHALEAGTELLVPDRDPVTARDGADDGEDRPVVAIDPPANIPVGRRHVFYRVVTGDRVTDVARALGVRRDELLAWNSLDATARLQTGLWLQAYVNGEPADARVWDEREVEVLHRGTEAFYARAVASDGRVRCAVRAVAGDTMASVAQRYGLTVGSLARINRRARDSELTAGEALVVYTTAERATREHEHEHEHERTREDDDGRARTGSHDGAGDDVAAVRDGGEVDGSARGE